LNCVSLSGLDHFESDPVSACSLSDPACSLSDPACSLSEASGNKLVPQTSTEPSQLIPFRTNSPTNNSTKGTSLTPSEACSLSPDSTCSFFAVSPSAWILLTPLTPLSLYLLLLLLFFIYVLREQVEIHPGLYP